MVTEPVLLVDPDPAFLRIVQRVFDAAGLDLDTASTGEEALIMLGATAYAVVVGSSNLTDMEAIRFFTRAASMRPDCECIALIAEKDPEIAANLYDHCNLFNHLWKPVDEIGDLTRQVGRAHERRALKRHSAYLLTELRDARGELREQGERLDELSNLALLGQAFDRLATEMCETLHGMDGQSSYLALALADRGREGWTGAQVARMRDSAECIRGGARKCLAGIARVQALRSAESASAEPTDVAELVAETLDMVRTSAQERGIEIHADLRDGLPAVSADPHEVRQAISHVIDHAILSMPHGGVLALSTDASTGPQGAVSLRVRDSGAGIPAGRLARVFDPLMGGDPLSDGSALGLHAARTAVRRHGGDIRVESKPGLGTTVHVSLPVSAPANTEGIGAQFAA